MMAETQPAAVPPVQEGVVHVPIQRSDAPYLSRLLHDRLPLHVSNANDQDATPAVRAAAQTAHEILQRLLAAVNGVAGAVVPAVAAPAPARAALAATSGSPAPPVAPLKPDADGNIPVVPPATA